MPEARTKIRIRRLYKIFGPDPLAALALTEAGMGRSELLDNHGHVLALGGIDLEIAAGAIHVVMGLSGSGKSTLVRHINRLIEPTAGGVAIDGEDILAFDGRRLTDLRRRRIAMVFQRFALFPHRTVAENIAYVLAIQGATKASQTQSAARWIERIGLAGFADHYPSQLSGGMQQRVGLARALATEPEILLMDEPFSALDPLIRSDMRGMLLELQADLNKTIVFITHDLDEALAVGGRISILRHGAIEQTGAPEDIVLSPANAHVAEFVADINRGRLLSVAAIMETGASLAIGLAIEADTVLEDAAHKLAAAGIGEGRVVDADGETLGTVRLERILAVIARPASAS
ncbi:MAG: betaine/proline/choline family ABC transporter ATP-binding protein [Rhodospirillales bacterium]